MYHWTDSDVGAIIGLVARTVASADGSDESLVPLLQELGQLLHANQWLLELGELPSNADRQWVPMRSLSSPESSGRHMPDVINRYGQYLELAADDPHTNDANDCTVVSTQCRCQRGRASHPTIACIWSASGTFFCLELAREIGEHMFSERDRAILRVMANQVHQVANGSIGLVAKTQLTLDLSRRQREVLDLLLMGKNSKQIAAELRLSVYTVNDYIKALYRRYDVSCRAELLAAIHVGA